MRLYWFRNKDNKVRERWVTDLEWEFLRNTLNVRETITKEDNEEPYYG